MDESASSARFLRLGDGACFALQERVKRILLLAALAACTSSPPGGDPPDNERVTVIAPYFDARGGITPGATVLYYDADGVLVDRVVTDGQGYARSIAGPISSVLVAPPTAGGDYYSWLGVWPGDHLTTQHAPAPVAATPGHHMAFTLPRFANDAASYSISAVGMAGMTAAAAGTDDVTLDATVEDDAPAVGDVVAEVATGAARHFIVAHGVAVDAGAVDLRASHWEMGAPFSATIALPEGAAWLAAYDKRLSNGRVLWVDTARTDAPAGNVALSFLWPTAGDAGALAVDYQLADGTTYALSYNEPPDGLDTAPLMPLAQDVARAADGSVTWNRSLTSSDEIGVELVQLGDTATWHIVMPPGERSFTPPVIPADVQPPAMTTARVTFVVGNEPGAYGALRSDPDVFDLPNWGHVMPRIRGTYRFAGI